MPEKKLEDMSQEEKVRYVRYINRLLKKSDFSSFFHQLNWSLSEPRCLCDSCDEIYQSWLEAGKEFYKDDINDYEKQVREANLLREQRKEERRLSRQVGRRSHQLLSAYS